MSEIPKSAGQFSEQELPKPTQVEGSEIENVSAVSSSDPTPASQLPASRETSPTDAVPSQGDGSSRWWAHESTRNLIAFLSFVVAVATAFWGVSSNLRAHKLEIANTALNRENLLLSTSALNLEASRTISTEAASLGGVPITVDKTDTSKREEFKDPVPDGKKKLHSLNLSAVYAVWTHASVLGDEAVQRLSAQSKNDADALPNGVQTDEQQLAADSPGIRLDEFRSDFLKRYVLPFLFAKAKAENSSVRGSVLVVCSKILSKSHRSEMMNGDQDDGNDSLRQFGDVFSENNYDEAEFRGFDVLNFSGLPFNGSTLKGADLTAPDFSGSRLVRVDGSGAVFKNAKLIGAESTTASTAGHAVAFEDGRTVRFVGADFRGTSDFTGTKFPNSDFSSSIFNGPTIFGGDTNFSGAWFKDVTFSELNKHPDAGRQARLMHRIHGLKEKFADFSKADFSGAKLKDLDVKCSNFRDAKFVSKESNHPSLDSCEINDSQFWESDFSGARFDGAHLANCDFTNGCTFQNAKFIRVGINASQLTGVTFGGDKSSGGACTTQMTGVDFGETQLRDVVFVDCNAVKSRFEAASFGENVRIKGGCFPHANFKRASFNAADDLKKTEFVGTDLTGADFRDCSLVNVGFRGAKLNWALILNEPLTDNTVGYYFANKKDAFTSVFDWDVDSEDVGAILVEPTKPEEAPNLQGTYIFRGFIFRRGSTLGLSPPTAYHMVTKLRELEPQTLSELLFPVDSGLSDEKVKVSHEESLKRCRKLLETMKRYRPDADPPTEQTNKDRESIKKELLESNWKMRFES